MDNSAIIKPTMINVDLVRVDELTITIKGLTISDASTDAVVNAVGQAIVRPVVDLFKGLALSDVMK